MIFWIPVSKIESRIYPSIQHFNYVLFHTWGYHVWPS